MPVSPLFTRSDALFFAQFADGEGMLFSQILPFNMDVESDAEARLILKGNSGSPLTVDLNGALVEGELDSSIPACGMQVLSTDGQGTLQIFSPAAMRRFSPR